MATALDLAFATSRSRRQYLAVSVEDSLCVWRPKINVAHNSVGKPFRMRLGSGTQERQGEVSHSRRRSHSHV